MTFLKFSFLILFFMILFSFIYQENDQCLSSLLSLLLHLPLLCNRQNSYIYVVVYLCRHFLNVYMYFNFSGKFLKLNSWQIGSWLKSSLCSSTDSRIRSCVSTPSPFSTLTKPAHTQRKASLLHFESPLKKP